MTAVTIPREVALAAVHALQTDAAACGDADRCEELYNSVDILRAALALRDPQPGAAPAHGLREYAQYLLNAIDHGTLAHVLNEAEVLRMHLDLA